jgi:hypothetical protein
MPKRQTNKLKWTASLMELGETQDPETDRVTKGYTEVRKIKYRSIGVTAADKFSTKDTNEVVKKIEVRLDRTIENNQKAYRLQVQDVIYDIERLYVREEDRVMELSLAYVN